LKSNRHVTRIQRRFSVVLARPGWSFACTDSQEFLGVELPVVTKLKIAAHDPDQSRYY